MSENINEEQEILEGCTCNEEYVTAPCPVCFGETDEFESPFEDEDELIITDANLTEEIWGMYEGFKFTCPECKVPSIMVNAVMGKFCVACGKRVLVQSKTVTDYVKNLNNPKSKYKKRR
jgi:hypothetical protein